MNKLQAQQENFESIKSLCTNYKKDSSSRKTQDYLNNRLTSLDALWGNFENQHTALVKETEDKNINYFTEDIYGKTKAMYESTKSNIIDMLHNLQKESSSVKFDLTGVLDDETGDHIKTLLSKQEINFKAIDRAMSKIVVSSTDEKWELEDNLNILKSKWAPIDKLHWEIDSFLKGTHQDYYRIFVDIESQYDHMRKKLSSKIWSTAHYQQSAPRIEIPEFSGNYNQWISFKDLFIEAVHNNPTINKAQKMQHLKTKLKGEAERLVQHLTISAENYVSCWDILNQRYDNRRLQFISFMNTLLQLPIIQQPDAYNLKKMHDVTTECLSGLSNIGLDTSTWDPIIVYLMTQKLDSATHNEYVKELRDHREVPALHDFLFFLESKFMAYETMRRPKKDVVVPQKAPFVKPFNKEYAAKKYPFNYNKTYPKTYHAVYGQCPFCDGSHVLMQCQKFIALDVLQRNNTVAKLQICKNCLFSHGNKECISNKTCKECNMKHHSLLHNTIKKITSATNSGSSNSGQRPSNEPQASSNHHLATKEMEVLLTTVQLKLQALDGTFITLRALLDQGSQVNLITENAAQLLRLPRKKMNATISGIGELSGNCKGKLKLTCKSLYSDFTFETEAMIIKKLTNNLPNATFEKTTWPHLNNLKLADTDFNMSRPVDLLLGADVYADIIMDGVLKGDQQSPVAQQTQLGWILCGKLITFNCHATLIDINEITQFWENEDIAQNSDDVSKDEQCELYYNQTTQRDESGKYIVKMPLAANFEENLGKSKQIAISQFLQLEKRLERQKKLAQMYKDFINEYADLQHMKVSTSTSAKDCYLQSTIAIYNNMKLNRWIGTSDKEIELLGFCDASEKAFSCVIYTRTNNNTGKPTITLLTAKTRVAPLAQKITLPRLELCGALLLSKLMKKAMEAYKDSDITIRAWCDSQVVLAWLQGDTSRWEKYVANRVTTIKQTIPAQKWQYIKSEQNPADCASRGLYPSKLTNFDLWWHGPTFLKSNEYKNKPFNLTCLFTTDVGTSNKMQATLATEQTENFITTLLQKHSSLIRVIRITAWILRFSSNARNNKKFDAGYLTTGELMAATEHVIRCAQKAEFAQEYKLLTKNKTVNKNSCVYKLNPYLDKKGIIRVGGRLNKSNLPPGMKNPAILPKKGPLTRLIVHQGHLQTLHGGARQTLAYIRQRYWIVGGNRAVKDQLRHCVRCHRFKPMDHYQLMADLPPQRTNPSRPFTHTGVDFTGHVEVKLNKGRGVKTSKGYIAVFLCMTTKAVHIELASDMSTETFIAAFQRMCARRGTPKHMYSDCGTNFVGASKVLRNEFEKFKQILSTSFFDEIGKLEVEWHFNVPAWPSAGGAWEAAVKGLKYHLKRVLGDQKLTYEEFTTLLSKIEACMNSRPLCPLTEDPDEFYHYLTPGHFLTGSPILALPLSDHCDVRSIDLRRRWQLTEHMMQQFWKHWSSDYLSQLQKRSKWNKPTKNIKEGDIVLVKEDNLPPGKWALGRVLKLHPGADGYVRVTTVKTQNSTIKRPIVKLAPLPVDPNPEDIQLTPKPDYKETETNAKKPARSAPSNLTKKRCFMTLFTTLITMCALANGSHAAGYTSMAQITSLEPERPIYYDSVGKIQMIHNEWTLLMYYNLTNYWDGIRRVETYLFGIDDWCQKTDPRYCKTTLEQLYHEMKLIEYYNTILLAPHKHLTSRKRRGLIDGVGYLTNSLFGILDQRFAEKYKKDIEAVQNNENHLLELIKNQTTIVELENSVLKRHEDNIKRQFDVIENFMNQTNLNFAKIETEIEIVMATSYFNSAALSAYLLINNLKAVQEMLFNSLTDVYKGHIDVHLVTPVNLVKQLSEISGKLPKTLSLPVDSIREDVKDLYKLLYIKARATDNFFLFELHIPLTSDEDFSLHRVIPLPIKTNSGFTIVQTSSTYIAVNFQKNTYVSLLKDDLKQCVQMKPGNFICNKNLPVFNLHNSNIPCEAKLLSHRATSPCDVMTTSCKEAWFELHSPNAWLAVCCETCTLRTICENDVTSYTMNSSGLVTLAQGCVLQSNYLTINSHNEYNSRVKINYNINVPSLNSSVNKIVNLTYQNLPGSYLSETQDTEEIFKKLQYQKENENQLPSVLTTHDIHQYAVCYSLLAAAIVAVTLWAVGRYYPHLCTKRKQRSHCSLKSVKPHYEDIEMQPIPRTTNSRRETTPGRPRIQAGPEQRQPAPNDNVAFNFD